MLVWLWCLLVGCLFVCWLVVYCCSVVVLVLIMFRDAVVLLVGGL